MTPPNATLVVQAALCILHNFLHRVEGMPARPNVDAETEIGAVVPGIWRAEVASTAMEDLTGVRGNVPRSSKKIQEEFARYFSSNAGKLPWQMRIIGRE